VRALRVHTTGAIVHARRSRFFVLLFVLVVPPSVLVTGAGCSSDAMPASGTDSGAVRADGGRDASTDARGVDAPSAPDTDDGGGGGAEDGGTVGPDAGPDGGPDCRDGRCDRMALALGAEHSCVIERFGQVLCWGRGADGELGDGRTDHSPGCGDVDCAARPQRVALGVAATSIGAAGGTSACAVLASGEVWCWGSALAGRPAGARLAPERVEGLSEMAQISDSASLLCGLRIDGSPVCAGRNSLGQAGVGAISEIVASPMPVLRRDESAPDGASVPLTGGFSVRTAAGSGDHACMATSGRRVYCWGSDHAGQLGDGDSDLPTCTAAAASGECSPRAIPITALPTGVELTQVALGRSHTCALAYGSGFVLCWGDNSAGQLGIGTTVSSAVPVLLTGLPPVVELSAGALSTCVRTYDGSVRCWGANDEGQIGDGIESHGTSCVVADGRTIDCVLTPTLVASIEGAQALASGRSHSCVIRSPGTEVWCWGANDKLQLGDGPDTTAGPADRSPRYVPVRVEGL
jgi:alpha-tubulin suppressor-like RCC1 family protein